MTGPSLATRTIEVAGVRLRYLEAGTGPAVLFLHGWPTNADLWRNVAPVVAAVGRRVVVPDLPGFGHSDKTSRSYSFPYYDRVLTELVHDLGIGSTGLVVHDLGGPVGLYWASRHPGAVSEIAVLNTLVFPEMSWAVKAFVAATRTLGVRDWLASPAGIRATVRLGMSTTPTAETLARYTAPFEDRTVRPALLAAGHGLHPGGFRRIADWLPVCGIPMFGVYGAKDRILPDIATTMRRLATAVPGTDVRRLDHCGHFLQEDDPAALADLLAGFLAAGVT